MIESVVFVLDSSMDEIIFDTCKEHIQNIIIELMIQNKRNEVCIILCKTINTNHHLHININNNDDDDDNNDDDENDHDDEVHDNNSKKKIKKEQEDNDDDDDDDSDEEEEIIPFMNLTEIPMNGLTTPNVNLLRTIKNLKCTAAINPDSNIKELRGDVMDGIFLAADTLHNNIKYKRERKIIILTDAQHDFIINGKQLLHIIDSLRKMNCRIHTIGIGFDHNSCTFNEPITIEEAKIKREEQQQQQEHDENGNSNNNQDINSENKRIKLENESYDVELKDVIKKEENNEEEKEEESDAEDEEDYDDQILVYTDKTQREELLISLTEKTGGEVIAVTTLKDVLEQNKGKKIIQTTKYNVDLHIAPTNNCIIPVKHFALLKKETTIPTLKKEFITTTVDNDNDNIPDNIRSSSLNNNNEKKSTTATTFQKKVVYYDPDKPDDPIEDNDRTTAIQFGSTLIPISIYDYEGIVKCIQKPKIIILGYMSKHNVPTNYYASGPPSCIMGWQSLRSCTAIAALAQTLYKRNKVAIALWYKTTRSKQPLLIALYPLIEEQDKEKQENEKDNVGNSNIKPPLHLITMQLPFQGEVKQLELTTLQSFFNNNDDNDDHKQKEQVCDELIDTLMLPNNVLNTGQVPSPVQRSWNQTLVQKALSSNNTPGIVTIIDERLQTPSYIVENAKPAIEKFQEIFPLQSTTTKKAEDDKQKNDKKTTAGRKVITYTDFL